MGDEVRGGVVEAHINPHILFPPHTPRAPRIPHAPHAPHTPHAPLSVDYRFAPTVAPTVPTPNVAPPSSVGEAGPTPLVLAGAVGGACGLLALGAAIWYTYRPRSGRSLAISKGAKSDATVVMPVVRDGNEDGDTDLDDFDVHVTVARPTKGETMFIILPFCTTSQANLSKVEPPRPTTHVHITAIAEKTSVSRDDTPMTKAFNARRNESLSADHHISMHKLGGVRELSVDRTETPLQQRKREDSARRNGLTSI